MREQLLLFHFEDPVRLSAVRKAVMPLKIACKVIDDADCDKPIGTFIGLETMAVEEATPAELTDEVMVLCGLTDSAMQAVLSALRKAGLYIPYKAMLTPTNKDWTAKQLFAELYEEHQTMMEQMRQSVHKD